MEAAFCLDNDESSSYDAFQLVDCDEIPTKRYEPGGYKKKSVDAWGWQDFQGYFDSCYREEFGKFPIRGIGKERAKYKRAIEISCEFWGPDTVKNMIDWLFRHYKEYPKFTDIHIGLLVGSHKFASFIGEQVNQENSYMEDKD